MNVYEIRFARHEQGSAELTVSVTAATIQDAIRKAIANLRERGYYNIPHCKPFPVYAALTQYLDA